MKEDFSKVYQNFSSYPFYFSMTHFTSADPINCERDGGSEVAFFRTNRIRDSLLGHSSGRGPTGYRTHSA